MLTCSKVIFKPWVGAQYEEGFKGNKLLVLGESHYCSEDCKECNVEACMKKGYSEEDYYNQTIEGICGYLHAYEGARFQQTFLCFERAVLGKVASNEEQESFWNHLAFYNYVQNNLHKEAGCRTNLGSADSANSEVAFKEILETLNPNKVIVWGKRLYNYLLPAWDGFESEVKTDNGCTRVWTYTINGKRIPCMVVNHPSTPSGKSWNYWHPFYEVFLNQ
jgi:hypothetical protein